MTDKDRHYSKNDLSGSGDMKTYIYPKKLDINFDSSHKILCTMYKHICISKTDCINIYITFLF